MSIFGCHSCGFNLIEHCKNGGTYENSRCATCKLAKEYYHTPKANFYDSEDFHESENGVDRHRTDEGLIVNYSFGEDEEEEKDPSLATPNDLKLIRETIERQLWVMLSNSVIKLLRIAKSDPVMFEIIIKKMQYPYMSYSEIGDSMTPRVSKQSVLYNLKHAIEEYPDLSYVFITDTRFSAGKNALETLAHKVRRESSQEELRGVLYGKDERLKAVAMKTLNDVLKTPWMSDASVLDFEYYGDDETELRNERTRVRNREKWEEQQKCQQD